MMLSRVRFSLARRWKRRAEMRQDLADFALARAKHHEHEGSRLWSRAIEARKAAARQVKP